MHTEAWCQAGVRAFCAGSVRGWGAATQPTEASGDQRRGTGGRVHFAGVVGGMPAHPSPGLT